MDLHSLRLGPRPAYTREAQQEAWRGLLRSSHGMIILDLLLHQAFLVQHGDVRGLGKQDLMLWIIDRIQDAEMEYGRDSDRDEQPPSGPEWWFPQPGR